MRSNDGSVPYDRLRVLVLRGRFEDGARVRVNAALCRALGSGVSRIVIDLTDLAVLDRATIEFLVRARLHCGVEGCMLTLHADAAAVADASVSADMLDALEIEC